VTATAETADIPTALSAETPTGAGARVRSALRALSEMALVRALRAQSLTAPGGVAAALLVLLPGLLADALTGQSFGRPTTVSVLLAGAACALTVRRSALGTAAALPPLLCAASVGVLALASGHNRGSRQLLLDWATTLALSAPAVFAATVLTLVLVLGRLAWGMVPR